MSIVDGPAFERENSAWVDANMAVVRAACVPSEMLKPPARKGDWLLTHTGIAYWPLDPRASEVNIKDIAHSLAMQCRYGGHCRQFYSVAEHSWLMSYEVPEEHALQALLHDATEGYVSDVPRPLKPHLSNFGAIEDLNRNAISCAFGIATGLPECVIDLDRRMCIKEMKVLMPQSPLPLGISGETPSVCIYAWSWQKAEEMFLKRFDELWAKRMADHYPAAHYERKA